MKPKPDVSTFLDGATPELPRQPSRQTEAKAPAGRTVTIEVTKPEPTIQKLFRLRWDVANALKMGALQESAATGRRVTETEIIERLLRAHFKLDI